MENQIALKMTSITKRFPGTIAVDNVDFDVKAGEVHALMGENGAGKSTLMKTLAGSFSDYTGEITIEGKQVKLYSPAIAKAEGVAMIYQELSIAYNRTVYENILAGHIPTKGMFVDKSKMNQLTMESLKKVGLDKKIKPNMLMNEISQHEAQLIEIAKALDANPKIIVMDEPTSALSRDEVEILFEIIGEIKKKGIAIIYISHHLPEVFQVSDRVTVMRDGKKIETRNIEDVTPPELVEMMVGSKIAQFNKGKCQKNCEKVLEVKNFTRYGFFHYANLTLHKGEILGLAGLAGAGRTELVRCLAGLDPINEGELYLEDSKVIVKNMHQMVQLGVSYLSENRKTEGLSLRLTSSENVFSCIIENLSRFGIYNPKRGKSTLEGLFADLNVNPPNPNLIVSSYSGGNQQKILLAKWLATKPKVLILDEPTRGVDIAAKQTIHETIVRLVKEGVSVILVSSDLPELVALSDRIVVINKGHLIGEMEEGTFDENSILLAANGERGGLSVSYQ